MRIKKLLELSIRKLIIENNSGFSETSFGRVNTKDMDEIDFKIKYFKKIEYNLSEVKLEILKQETLEIGNELLKNHGEIISYIEQQDDIDIDVSDFM